MTELERERGEFEKWAKTDGFPDADLTACGCQKKEPFHYQDAYTDFAHRAWQARAGLSSQQSTLRRVRAILGNSIIIDADKPLVRDVLAAIEREFGGVECQRKMLKSLLIT